VTHVLFFGGFFFFVEENCSNAFGSFVLTVIKADNLLAMDSTGWLVYGW
jgi:hypothetical protein